MNWAVRHPDHDRWSEPLSTPPSDVMESLVGRAVELLRPGENAWHKALVQDYSPHSGKHCVLFADGETEWLALPRGFYAWQVSARSTLSPSLVLFTLIHMCCLGPL